MFLKGQLKTFKVVNPIERYMILEGIESREKTCKLELVLNAISKMRVISNLK